MGERIFLSDITLIPALARLLDTDANTLLSFKDDLSKNEIALILNDITSKMEKESFVDAYNTAMEKIKEYPNSEELIFYSALVLSGGIELYYASNKDYYKEELDNLFKRVIYGDNDEIREQALQIVCSKYIQNNEFNKAEEIILKLDDKSFD
ncbi:MAG: transcriptional regulator, partial [Clostridia bacterium]